MKYFFLITLVSCWICPLQAQQTPFEKSGGKETATYREITSWYRGLSKRFTRIRVKEMGMTDAGYPLQLVMISNDGNFDPRLWHQQHKAVILVNNGIHPGEPDGIDASMMLVRDLLQDKVRLPDSVVVAFIPVYNIGGCLNRNAVTRVNQNGPKEYGFRGNSQNLDLNRDFTKCDSKEARTFTQIFHYLNPGILIDNHVSDGADFQYTMTLITTQYEKLYGDYGRWLKEVFEPGLYETMSKKNQEMCPYVDFENTDMEKGMKMFYDPPRYSSGYASLFGTIGFIPETHMLKPFKDRVMATYAFMQSAIEMAGRNSRALWTGRQKLLQDYAQSDSFPLKWVLDTTYHDHIPFKGYGSAYLTSEVTGFNRMYYDHNQPFTKVVKYFNRYLPSDFVQTPSAYIIPQGWHAVTDLLKLNGIRMKPLEKDTIIQVSVYHINTYKSYPEAYEKHHKNYDVSTSLSKQALLFQKGDMLIPMNQPGCRYLIEMLEPTGNDSFFAWNFFDAILQQKEGYSDYRWEDVAAEILKKDPDLKLKLEQKKASDPKFASNPEHILEFIYRNSMYYEKEHLRYPVFRIE
jgi:hypothetical protein